MRLIKKFIKRVGEKENIVVENSSVKVLDNGEDFQFISKKDRPCKLSLKNGEEFEISKNKTFSKNYLIENSAVLLSGINTDIYYFGDQKSIGTFEIKLTKDQLRNLKGVFINSENYCKNNNFSIVKSKDKDKIIILINNFPPNIANVEIKFKSKYPIIIFTNRLDNIEKIDLSDINPYTILINTPSKIDGEFGKGLNAPKISEKTGKELSITNEISSAELKRRIDIKELEKMKEKWNNKTYSLKLYPDKHAPVSKTIELEPGLNEIVFRNDEFKQLCQLELNYNVSGSVNINPKYDSDVTNKSKYREVKRIGDKKFLIKNIIPNEKLTIYYEQSRDFDETLTRISPLRPGEKRNKEINMTRERKEIDIKVKSENDYPMISINDDKTKQIKNEDKIKLDIEGSTFIKIKSKSGELIFQKNLKSENIREIEKIEIEKDSVNLK